MVRRWLKKNDEDDKEEEISGHRLEEGAQSKDDSIALQDYKCLMSFTTLHLNTSVLLLLLDVSWGRSFWHQVPRRNRRRRRRKSRKKVIKIQTERKIQISPWTASHLRRFTTANPFDSLTCHHLYHFRFSFPSHAPARALVLNLLKFFFRRRS